LRSRLRLEYAVDFGEIEFGSVVGNRSRLEFGSCSRHALEAREAVDVGVKMRCRCKGEM
jgi:hypothetical protein